MVPAILAMLPSILAILLGVTEVAAVASPLDKVCPLLKTLFWCDIFVVLFFKAEIEIEFHDPQTVY